MELVALRRYRVHIEREDEDDPCSPVKYVACPPDPNGGWVRWADVEALLVRAVPQAREALETPPKIIGQEAVTDYARMLERAELDCSTYACWNPVRVVVRSPGVVNSYGPAGPGEIGRCEACYRKLAGEVVRWL